MTYTYLFLGAFALAYYIVLGLKLGTWDTVFSKFWIVCGVALLVLGKLSFDYSLAASECGEY